MRIGDFVGNPSLVRLLAKASLPQTALFAGPAGVGKKSLAVALAALANCLRPAGGDLCGACSSCLKIDSGNHPDVVLVDAKWVESFLEARKKRFNPQVIPIDVARELVREAQYRPYEGKLRVFVVDEAEKLNEAAANALLKTLEEPPEGSRVILVTAFPNRLLPTIRSRCQTFVFRPLSRREIRLHLEATMEAGRARLLAAFADGSIGAALGLDLEARLRDRDLALEILTDWIRRRSFARLHFACERDPLKGDLKSRERVQALLEQLQTLSQDLYFLQVETPERVINEDRVQELRELQAAVSLDWAMIFLYHLREAKRDVERYVNTQLCFETLWLTSQMEEHAVDTYRQV